MVIDLMSFGQTLRETSRSRVGRKVFRLRSRFMMIKTCRGVHISGGRLGGLTNGGASSHYLAHLCMDAVRSANHPPADDIVLNSICLREMVFEPGGAWRK
jgi:hypothetical protein